MPPQFMTLDAAARGACRHGHCHHKQEARSQDRDPALLPVNQRMAGRKDRGAQNRQARVRIRRDADELRKEYDEEALKDSGQTRRCRSGVGRQRRSLSPLDRSFRTQRPELRTEQRPELRPELRPDQRNNCGRSDATDSK